MSMLREVVNYVAVAELNQTIPALLIKQAFPDAVQKSSRIAGSFIEDGRVSLLAFNSGKIIICGARSRSQLTGCVKRFVRKANRFTQSKYKRVKLRITNVVGKIHLLFRIDCEKLARNPPLLVSYERELFCGAIVKPFPDRRISFTVFPSGKLHVTGLTSEADFCLVSKHIYVMLWNCKINNVT